MRNAQSGWDLWIRYQAFGIGRTNNKARGIKQKRSREHLVYGKRGKKAKLRFPGNWGTKKGGDKDVCPCFADFEVLIGPESL